MAADRTDKALVVTDDLAIPATELSWRFSASGGPGGQHANRANTKVELRFDVAASESLTAGQRSRLQDKFGPVVAVVVDDERSQARNRDIALDRLAGRLAEGLKVQKRRRPTKPGRGAKERRLEAKRQQSQRKKGRRPPRGGWD